jgi:hypothetical protein
MWADVGENTVKKPLVVAALLGASWMTYATHQRSCGLILLTNPLGLLTLAMLDAMPSLPIEHFRYLRLETWLTELWLIAMSSVQWALVVFFGFWLKRRFLTPRVAKV